MKTTSRIELNTRRTPEKAEFLVLKMYDGGATYVNNQIAGGTPYEVIGVLRKAILELETMGAALTATVEREEQPACQCLLRSLRERSELPYGCNDCMSE